MRLPTIYPAIILLSLTFAGCAPIPEKGPNIPDDVVWSDDGDDVAVIEQDEDGYRIFLQKPDGGQRRPLSVKRPHKVGHVYYMKQANYLIVETLLPNGGIKIDKFNMTGQETPIIETKGKYQSLCPGQANPPLIDQAVLPSPDGKILAHVYSQECGQVTVDFLRPKDLLAMDSHTFTITGPAWATWHRSGHLIVAQESDRSAWRMKPEAPPEMAEFPLCQYPPTTSSAISNDGKVVYLGLNGEVEISALDDPTARIFGCQ